VNPPIASKNQAIELSADNLSTLPESYPDVVAASEFEDPNDATQNSTTLCESLACESIDNYDDVVNDSFLKEDTEEDPILEEDTEEDSILKEDTEEDYKITHTPYKVVKVGQKYSALHKLYRICDKANGNLGPSPNFGQGIYGELTMFSMHKVIRVLMKNCSMTYTSIFLDIGSGLGKPCLNTSVVADVQMSFGVEVNPTRYYLSLNNLGAILDKDSNILVRNRILFLNDNACDFESFEPCTHIYTFDCGIPPEDMVKLAKVFNNTSTAEYLVSYNNPNDISDYGFNVTYEGLTIPNLSMQGSQGSRTAYFYRSTVTPSTSKVFLTKLEKLFRDYSSRTCHIQEYKKYIKDTTQAISHTKQITRKRKVSVLGPSPAIANMSTPSSKGSSASIGLKKPRKLIPDDIL